MTKQSRHEPNTTHYIPDVHTKTNLASLAGQERLMTGHMGGPLPEQPDPALFQAVLDIGCGSGSWIIDTAKQYPIPSLVGIDIDEYGINYARSEAETANVAERVEFRRMDALKGLALPDNSFDLVNLRLGSSFVRTWEWPDLLKELLRVTRPKGVIRLVEMESLNQSSSAALVKVGQLHATAYFHSGHFFDPKTEGLTSHLEELLRRQRCQQVQTHDVRVIARAGTEKGKEFLSATVHLLPLLQPFIQKWNGENEKEYARLCQQILNEMQNDPNFYLETHFVTTWGIKEDLAS